MRNPGLVMGFSQQFGKNTCSEYHRNAYPNFEETFEQLLRIEGIHYVLETNLHAFTERAGLGKPRHG